MKSVSLNTLIFILLIAGLATTANASEWQRKRKATNKSDIAVYMLKSPPEGLHVFKGVTHMPYSEEAIINIVSEHKYMCRIVYQCKKIWPISVGDKNYTYLQLSGIWPVKGRDLVIQQSHPKPSTLSFQNVDGIVQTTEKYIRITELNNTWVFSPTENGWTKIELTTSINPGGSVPYWLVNTVSINAPVHTLENVRQLLDEQNTANGHDKP